MKDEISEKAKELSDSLTRYLNTLSSEDERIEALVGRLMCEHRTLQQATMRFVVKLVRAWAKQEHYDLRNQATIELCKKNVCMIGH